MCGSSLRKGRRMEKREKREKEGEGERGAVKPVGDACERVPR
jgi:hypothetical protein